MSHGCEGKMRVPADEVQRVLRQRNKNTSRPLNAYKCHECGAWHIGQPAGKVSRETYGKRIARKSRGIKDKYMKGESK